MQSQIIFPAAGYPVAALQAAQHLVSDESLLRMIEVQDFTIHRPMMLDTDQVQVVVALNHIQEVSKASIKEVRFPYSAGVGDEPTNLILLAGGTVRVYLGEQSITLLPLRQNPAPSMAPIHPERLYKELSTLGYNYSGSFKTLSSLPAD